MKNRRIFYVDVGNLPRDKTEKYLTEIAEKFKSSTSSVEDVVTVASRSEEHMRVETIFVPETSDEVLELVKISSSNL